MSNDSKGLAIITGTSTGIGAVYADRLARRGYDLLLVARTEARLSAVAERIARDTGRSAAILRVDLADPAQLAAFAARVETDPDLTLFVNNAGMSLHGTLASSMKRKCSSSWP
ncbi:SDR family NAD(P)-dependent oxidoreductase [Azorhizobium doebereinerae]|uniref:SDR family NAD(P)-dependent oxidoreductase n=1 Tax=Azorhizobium doebereinerae TaxID=281091 RepID=UPI0004198716